MYLPRAMTDRTGLRLCAGLCPAAVAYVAFLFPQELYILFRAEGGFFKGDSEIYPQIIAALRRIRIPVLPRIAAKKVAKISPKPEKPSLL